MPLKEIENQLHEIKDQGFDYVQVSPITPTKFEGKYTLNDCEILYKPINFTVGNYLGSFKDLKRLCKKAHEIGLKISVNVVIRNVASLADNNFNPHDKVKLPKKVLENSDCWLKKKQMTFGNRYSEIHHCDRSAGLRYDSVLLKNIYYHFFKKLSKAGVDMLRIKQAKYIGLPSEGFGFWEFFKEMRREFNFEVYNDCTGCTHEIMDKYLKECRSKVQTSDLTYDKKDYVVMMPYDFDYYLEKNWNVDTGYAIYKYSEIVNIYKNTLFACNDLNAWKDIRIKEINSKH